MTTIGIIGNGPSRLVPDLSDYKNEVDIWIGADRGALTLIQQQINVDYAIGDFDSINEKELEQVKQSATTFKDYPAHKDKTDIEIAIDQAITLKPNKVYLFGVTGGRLDHTLINIQLLHLFVQKQIRAIIVDINNLVELTSPNKYRVDDHESYPYISFVPLTSTVKGLSLDGFYYPLANKDIRWGSTLCISNKLLSNYGTFSYEEGILLIIKSRDVSSNPIPT